MPVLIGRCADSVIANLRIERLRECAIGEHSRASHRHPLLDGAVDCSLGMISSPPVPSGVRDGDVVDLAPEHALAHALPFARCSAVRHYPDSAILGAGPHVGLLLVA